jgi:hypothetical protein
MNKKKRRIPSRGAMHHAATTQAFTETCSKKVSITGMSCLLTFKSKWSLQSSGSGKELIKTQK